jgi:PAS domain S-box-containing protein
VPPRQLSPVVLVLAATIAGFIGARLLGERDARRESEHRADVAAAQIRARLDQGASLTDGLRRYMVGVPGRGVTSADFAGSTSRWLSPAGFPAAAWVERVPAARREEYERRTGRIRTQDREGRIVPAGLRRAYLAATLVSGIPPMEVPATDLGTLPGMGEALSRAGRLYEVTATGLMTLPDGTRGLFLVRLAPRLRGGVVEPGFVVVFVSELSLRAAATDTDAAALRLSVGHTATVPSDSVSADFSTAGQRFELVLPRRPVQGAAAVLPWIILVAGLGFAALAAALAVNGARRAQAQRELDRIFTLTPDIIAVADFDGRFTRVNPAAEKVLGYTEEELLARPYVEMVHPDDRERTASEAAALEHGRSTLSFENRYIRKDGSMCVLEWTSTPVVEDRAMYAVARDVTDRRRTETELARLAAEQAALRRVATLVARGEPASEVFAAVAEEVGRLLDAQATLIARLEPDQTLVIVASAGRTSDVMPVGRRLEVESTIAIGRVVRSGQPAMVTTGGTVERMGLRCTVAVPIKVEGSLWGVITAGTDREHFPEDAAQRMAEFTELAGTAIANADSRSELVASRARVVAASDETRRLIERDLHDGAQQRLVHTVISLKLAKRALEEQRDDGSALVAEALAQAEQANVELRELVHGILPPVLTQSGLRAAVDALADRMSVPVKMDVDVPRLPPALEATAYFVIAEGLTNVVKHARATRAWVDARVEDGLLRVRVRDDGVGGARASGHGFVGLADRVAALDGKLHVDSPAGGGTQIDAEIPLTE